MFQKQNKIQRSLHTSGFNALRFIIIIIIIIIFLETNTHTHKGERIGSKTKAYNKLHLKVMVIGFYNTLL